MKKFLKIVLLTLILIFIINVFLDFYVSYRLQHCKSSLYVTWNEISDSDVNADMIIMGSSRAEWQFNPLIIDSILQVNSYILGFSGSSINRQVFKYNIYNHYQKKPKWLIINIDYVKTLVWTNGVYREQLFPYFTIPYMREQILKVESFSIIEKYIPIYRYTTYKGIWTLLSEEAKVVDIPIKGYTPYDKSWDPTEYNKVKTFHFETDKRTVKMFDEFLSERKNEGVQVIFCYAPIYIGLTEKVDNLQEVYDTFHFYADKYNIPILDYTFSELSKDTCNFFNATHLNKKGAELFSLQLATDLDSLGIIKLQ